MVSDYGAVSQKWLGPFVAHAQEAGVLTAVEAAAWWSALEQRARVGAFFFFFTGLWIRGRKL